MIEQAKFLLSRRAFLNATMAAAGTMALPHALSSVAHAQSVKELIWAKPLETTQLDPHTSILGSSWQVLHLVYSSLVDVDGDLRPIPALAESWVEESPTSYLFNLRQGLKFSDGSDVTTDDVVGGASCVSAIPPPVPSGNVRSARSPSAKQSETGVLGSHSNTRMHRCYRRWPPPWLPSSR